MPVKLKQSFTDTMESWLVRHIVFPIWTKRDHPAFGRYYREFQKSQFLTKKELDELQLIRLRKLLQHAHNNCPFYARRMDEAKLMPIQLKSLEELSRIRPLTKRDIQDYSSEIEAREFPTEKKVRNQTGGSTGSPLQFFVDKDRFDSRMASTHRHNLFAGLRPGDWQVTLWGSRLDQVNPETTWDHFRNKLLYRTLALNTSKIGDGDWSRFIADVRRIKPRVMVAYTQAAVLFARYLQQHNVPDIQFDSIITTAEMLLPGQREFLEKTFKGKVFNRYGCREVSVIASECEFHRGMHVNSEALYVEIEQDMAKPGKSGRILVTDLLNYSMPLIRYEIGDIGTWAEGQDCPCGRQLPLLADVQGRTTDFIVLEGRQISGPALTLVVSDMADVRQVQFVQRNPKLIILRVVPGNEYGPGTEEELRRRIGLYLGDLATLQIELTDSIASEVSGKYRFVVQECDTVEQNPESICTTEKNNART